MSGFAGRKRKFQRYANRTQSHPAKGMESIEKFPIISRVQSQEGMRRNLVIFQSSLDSPYTVLQNAVDRINGTLIVKNIGKHDGSNNFQLSVDNETLAEHPYTSLAEAKRELAELALMDLRKTCFTIFRKIHPRDSPKIALASSSSTANETANLGLSTHSSSAPNVRSIGGIGAKMMLQMGWTGGGLGAQEQGITDIVQPYLQIERQGLGTKNIVQEVTKVLQDYATSRDLNSIAFSPDFNKDERVIIHQVARRLNLKSKSYGRNADRVLVVQSKVSPWDLIRSLLENGGESEQLKLVLPTDISV